MWKIERNENNSTKRKKNEKVTGKNNKPHEKFTNPHSGSIFW